VKDPLLKEYYHKVTTLLSHFENAKVQHIPRCNNARANRLSKLALGKGNGRFDTVIQLTISGLTVSEIDCMNVETLEDWCTPVIQALKALM